MRILIKNLGPLKKAAFTLGDLTIICGRNNTGKTYATYATYGFLTFWKEFFTVPLKPEVIKTLRANGVVEVNLEDYVTNAQDLLDSACKQFKTNLPLVLGAEEKNFEQTEFCVQLDKGDVLPIREYESAFGSPNKRLFQISKSPDENKVKITLLVEKTADEFPSEVLNRMIGRALKDIIFGHIFPEPFICSAERTGVAIFRNDLNFGLSEVFDQLKENKDFDPFKLIDKTFRRHALPVVRNVDFMRHLEDIAKKDGPLAKDNPQLIDWFAKLINGEYKIGKDGILYFIPAGSRVRLTIKEGSSAVRSLLDLGFYIQHVAEKGQLLMIDEPELNLHPENQRRVARLLARLVNLGVRVYMTTHSDYIVKEINTLIMLKKDSAHVAKLREHFKYCAEELLDAEKVRAYVATQEPILLDGNKKKVRVPTFVQCNVSPDMGIDARSFDPTIREMNFIQESIIFEKEA
jgi:hypothetical protein